MGEVILPGRIHCHLGLTKGQRRAEKNAIITDSLPTLVEFVRVVGRAFAQAWSEVESIRTERRSTNCLHRGRKTFGSGEADASIIEDRIQKAREFSPLLEDNLDAYVAKAMSGNEFNDRCRRLWRRSCFRSVWHHPERRDNAR